MVTQNILNSMIVPCIFAMAVYTGSIEEFDLPTIVSVTHMIN